MSFGTLYNHNPSPRSTAILIMAKAHGLHLDVIYADKDDKENYEELLKYNPLGRVPTFVGSDGYVLTECIPITLYVTSQSDTTTLLGSSRRDYYDILKWMSFANSDFLLSIGGCILPLIGRVPFIRLNSSDSLIALHQHCKVTDDHLRTNKYLVGERVTIADIFVVAMLIGAYMVLHKVLQPQYPFMTRWFYEIYNMPMFKDVAGDLVLLDLPIPSLPGKEDNLTYGEQAEAQHAAGTVGA